jgi:DHA1 family multidrug resistance protein-like MFS transporter
MSTATAAGGIIGPLIGGLLSHWVGYRESFLLSGVVVLVAAFIGLIGAKEINFNRSRKKVSVLNDLKQAASNRQLLGVFGLTALVSTSVMLLEPLLTIYVQQIGGSKSNASLSSGIIFSSVGIATVIMGSRWGRVGQKVGYEKTLLIGLIGGGIGNLLQLGFHHLIGFGVLRFTYGLFFAAVYPALNSLIVKSTDSEFRGRAFSLNQSANQIGMMAGPLLGGILGGWIGISSVFLINGLILLGVAFVHMRKQKPARDIQEGTIKQ